MLAADKDVKTAAKRWKQEIEATLKDVDIKVKADTTQVKTEIEKAAKDKKATIEVDADTVKAEAEIDHAARDRKAKIQADFDTAYARKAGQLAAEAFSGAAIKGAAAAAESSTSMFSGVARSIGTQGAVGIAGLTAVIPVLTALAGVAAAAAGALALIPAAFAGIAAGAGVLKIGLSGIAEAYEAVSGAAKDAGKDAEDHARKVASANRSVESASRSLNSAIKSEEQAQKDVARARRDALRELQDINDELRNGAIDETQAQLDLAKAREELATGTFESSLDYQQAQLNVVKAEQRLKDIHEDNVELDADVIDKRQKGVEKADDVVAAEDRLATAQQNTATAQTALADAQAALVEAQNETSTSAEKAAEAMGLLAPAGQDFVNALMALTPVWNQFKQDLQQPLLEGLGDTLKDTVAAVLPAITPGLQRIAGAFNAMFKEFGEWLQKPENVATLERIIGNIATAFEKLVPAIQPIADAFSALVGAGSDFLPDLAEGLAGAATAFGDWITKASESGELQDFIQTGLDTIKQLFGIFPSVVNLFEKLVPLGVVFTPILVNLVNSFLDLIAALADLWTKFSAISPVLNFTLPGAFKILTADVKLTAEKLEWLGRMFGWVRDAALNFADKVTTRFRDVKSAIAEMIPEAVKTTWEIFWDALSNKVERAVGAIKAKMQELKDFLKDLLPPWAQALLKVADVLGNRTTTGTAVPEPAPPAGPAPPPAAPGQPAPPAPAPPGGVGSGAAAPASNTSLAGALRARGVSEEQIRLIEAFSKVEGNAPGGLPTLGFTESQLGPGADLQARVDRLLKQFQERATVAGAFPTGGTAQQQAEWIAKVVGQSGVVDWQGNQQPQDYVSRVVSAMGSSVAPVAPSPAAPGVMPSGTYGLPGGTDTGGYGNATSVFPDWVSQLTGSYGVLPSTYAGHQESNRQEAGFAPNPQNLNRGIDWSGTPEQMDAFAEYIYANPSMVEQLIYQSPTTGKAYEIAGGKIVSGYYDSGTLSQHRNHVHTRQSQAIPAPGQSTVSQPSIGMGGDSHTIALDPNVPPGQQAAVKNAGQGMGEQLGKDIVSGMMEVFGFGDIFKDPTEFGIFKIFKSLMGVKLGTGQGGPNAGSTNAATGSGGGENPVLGILEQFIPGMGGNNTGVLNAASPLSQLGAPPGPSVDSHDMNVTVQGNVTPPVLNTMNTEHLTNLRNTPKGPG